MNAVAMPSLAPPPVSAPQVQELLRFVRRASPFYRAFYADVPDGETDLSRYPVLDHARFWQANGVEGNRVMTAPMTEGITFKSGGTTGAPKYSVFTHAEFRAFTQVFGAGIRRAGLQPGERIGNLFYAGRLYASFLFIWRSIEAAGAGICYPIGGSDLDEALACWRQFGLTTLAGVPTTLMTLIGQMSEQDRRTLKLRKFLYGGEPMFADQIAALQRVFPACEVRSIGIAGVDYGELGWAAAGQPQGVHHCFDESTVVEILDDDSGEPIEGTGIAGRLVVTNLNRRLMPIIRYPVGDRGQWLDAPGTPARRFRVLGRTEDGARVGPMTLYVEDIQQLLARWARADGDVPLQAFQLCIDHDAGRDRCLLRVAVEAPEHLGEAHAQRLRELIYAERHMFADLVTDGLVHPLQIEWVPAQGLLTNPRTGKLRRVVDTRHAPAQSPQSPQPATP